MGTSWATKKLAMMLLIKWSASTSEQASKTSSQKWIQSMKAKNARVSSSIPACFAARKRFQPSNRVSHHSTTLVCTSSASKCGASAAYSRTKCCTIKADSMPASTTMASTVGDCICKMIRRQFRAICETSSTALTSSGCSICDGRKALRSPSTDWMKKSAHPGNCPSLSQSASRKSIAEPSFCATRPSVDTCTRSSSLIGPCQCLSGSMGCLSSLRSLAKK
mmetsp:Transcript_4279/g.10872  ORF Transcript_4279/g.10872 Transcript_4279/m.10872 type:complete len:221 (+) Transcript_4279:277-939(+)